MISCPNWLSAPTDLRSPTRHLAAVSAALVEEHRVGLVLTCAGDGTIRCLEKALPVYRLTAVSDIYTNLTSYGLFALFYHR